MGGTMNHFAKRLEDDEQTAMRALKPPGPYLSLAPAPPPPPLTEPAGPWYNKMGERIMQIAEDPRNTWIGMSPLGMAAKIPKAAKAIKGLKHSLDEYRKSAPSMKGVSESDRAALSRLKENHLKIATGNYASEAEKQKILKEIEFGERYVEGIE